MRVLDTDVCIELLRGNERVLQQRAATDDEVATTWMTAAELHYGAERSAAPAKNRRLVARLLESLPITPSGEVSARAFGVTKSVLERLGQRLADADLVIAASCLSCGAVLVTGNTKHFGRVPGLQLEDWLRF